MPEPTPKAVHLADYTPSPYLIIQVELDVALFEADAQVKSRLKMQRNPAAGRTPAPLVLDGEELELESVSVNGKRLSPDEYVLDAAHLTLPTVPEELILETTVRIRPQQNTKLMGFYASKDGYFTQCEAEGFRRITFFLDRPDVMARYTVTLHADKARYPVLLANGNAIAQGDEANGRHWAKWEDPFPKPSYLFAMVAAKLDLLAETFSTASGKPVRLAIYVEPGKLDQAGFAMEALKKSMRFDEEAFGRELDLDQYMIVAVGDFNMGAMENKGLNIFNTKYVLARPDTATDFDYQNIDRVVGHEYFHNWTGNRITCRDWFQLSLKEGLTVYREQEFGAAVYSRATQRIRDVRNLRARQFPEDASPMAHPVRPSSYMEISNFYTPTIYEKGAEVVRMIRTLIGPAKFRRGMDLYFERHDGQAVRTDEFVQTMVDASGANLDQFKRWYEQAGTPLVEAQDAYDAATKTYTLTLRQSCPPTPEQPKKLPFHIPFTVGLVGADGKDLPLQLQGESAPSGTTRVLSLTEPEQRFVFVHVATQPVPSLARDFSAPINVRYAYDQESLQHLMVHDSDSFNRWEAGQRFATEVILQGVATVRAGGQFVVPSRFVSAVSRVLDRAASEPGFTAEALSLPSEAFIAEQLPEVDPDAIHQVRCGLARALGEQLHDSLLAVYHASAVPGPYSPAPAAADRRALRNLCLAYLMEGGRPEIYELVFGQFTSAANMTDSMAALAVLTELDCPQRTQALDAFYQRWQAEPLVVDKWLRAQAMSRLPGTLAEVQRLTQHSAFSLKNPNKVYALIGGFSAGNQVRFHAADGSGYDFLAAKVIELDALNPQVAARMARGFDRWKKFDAARQAKARRALESVANAKGLSKDVAEIVTKTLQ
jgi:aminopeptidase N